MKGHYIIRNGRRVRLCHVCYKNYCDIDNSRLICNECEKKQKQLKGKERSDTENYLNAFEKEWRKRFD